MPAETTSATAFETFGQRLRHHRQQCLDPRDGARLRQNRLADLLEAEPGVGALTGATISHWERGRYHINRANRPILLALIRVLYRCGGLATLAEAEALLAAGDYRALDAAEIAAIAPGWRPAPASAGPGFSPGAPVMTPPLPPQGLLGREAELAWVFEHFDQAEAVALQGLGGVGKTTLAQAVGRAAAARFPDGVLWAALGPRPARRPVLEQWGRALGADLLPLPNEAACQDRLRALLFTRRALLIVDDVWEADHARPLALGGPHCRLLVTTRERPIGHALATPPHTLPVGLLQPADALALLRRLAPAAAEAGPAAQRLCQRLEYLPLAITLAGRWLANEAEVPQRLDRLLTELIERREARLRLVQTEGRLGLEGEASVQAILGMSVERLAPEDQTRFAMLAAFGGEPLTWELQAAAYVWECASETAEAATARLIQRGLVEHRAGRYWMHALLADYADDLRQRLGL